MTKVSILAVAASLLVPVAALAASGTAPADVVPAVSQNAEAGLVGGVSVGAATAAVVVVGAIIGIATEGDSTGSSTTTSTTTSP